MDAHDRANGRPVELFLDRKKRLDAVGLTANVMISIGLDYTNEQDIDRFLNSKPGDHVFESLRSG